MDRSMTDMEQRIMRLFGTNEEHVRQWAPALEAACVRFGIEKVDAFLRYVDWPPRPAAIAGADLPAVKQLFGFESIEELKAPALSAMVLAWQFTN